MSMQNISSHQQQNLDTDVRVEYLKTPVNKTATVKAVALNPKTLAVSGLVLVVSLLVLVS